MESEPEYATERRASFQATPIMLDGTLYLSTPLGRVIALDPATGEERWEYDPQIRRDIHYGEFANRGVSAWLDPTAEEGAPGRLRIFVGRVKYHVEARDVGERQPCRYCGRRGF